MSREEAYKQWIRGLGGDPADYITTRKHAFFAGYDAAGSNAQALAEAVVAWKQEADVLAERLRRAQDILEQVAKAGRWMPDTLRDEAKALLVELEEGEQ